MSIEKTELIKKYYKETDPTRRRKILEKSIEQGEDPEGNRIRMELWESRYHIVSKAVKGGRGDGYIRLWMNMKFTDGNTGIFSGFNRASKEVRKDLTKLEFAKWAAAGGRETECFEEECLHAAALYLQSCESDHTYGSGILGMMSLKEEKLIAKIQDDFYGIAFRIPQALEMVEELKPITQAAMKVYQQRYPMDEFEEPTEKRRKLFGLD